VCSTGIRKFEHAFWSSGVNIKSDMVVTTYLYCTVSILLIPVPYIFSSRSNNVVSRVRGGRSPDFVPVVLTFVASPVLALGRGRRSVTGAAGSSSI
jgi:hypothetical protein